MCICMQNISRTADELIVIVQARRFVTPRSTIEAMNALVSTQRGSLATLDSFLRWHLDGAGFDRVYLYFDDPAVDAEALALARDLRWAGRVTVLEADHDFRLRERYSALPSWRDVSSSVASMVQSRQRLNCEHCLHRLCAAAGVRWLLHIDADELFMPAAGEGARTHFERLEAQGCWQFTYRNLEAAATTAASAAADYFADVSVFKQHEDALPAGALTVPGSASHSALKYWLERAQARVGAPVWFFFYSNGKGAVRVPPERAEAEAEAEAGAGAEAEARDEERLVCAGVHGWARGGADDGAWMRAHADGWRTNLPKVARRSELRSLDEAEGAVVLHYACCTAAAFAGKDWRALGYLGGQGGPWAQRWHQMQAQAQAQVHGDDGGEGARAAAGELRVDTALSVEEEHGALFGLSDGAQLRRHVAAGVLVRETRAADFLGGGARRDAADADADGADADADADAASADGDAHAAGANGDGEEEDEADDDASSSSSSVDEEEYARLREEAHARRAARRQRWVEAGRRLESDGYAIVDDFLGAKAAEALLRGVLALYEGSGGDDDGGGGGGGGGGEGGGESGGGESGGGKSGGGGKRRPSPFVRGKTGGGRDGRGEKHAAHVVRGDQVARLGEGEEGRVPGLSALLRQADELVAAMAAEAAPAETVAELRRVASRSRPMVACYPGGGARYVCHLDNPGGAQANGRLLTLLVYLNRDWCDFDGGMLRLHRPADKGGDCVDVEPLLDRCVVFWSDHRTPHEVLPAHKQRWAISAWYHHGDEAQAAAAAAAAAAAKGGDEEDDEGGDGVGGGISEASFGNTTEEIESFLLAMLAMKGGGGGGAAARPKNEEYRENLRSW